MTADDPSVLVFSSLFPSSVRPAAGLFVRERMFRVAERLPVTVVSPQPWFPLQGLLRRFVPHYRPMAPAHERDQGVDVYHPTFVAAPGVGRHFDGAAMARGAQGLVARLTHERGVELLDAHFAYPDGYAATLLGARLGLPVVITLRGTEVPVSRDPARRRRLLLALERAGAVIAVADALRRHVAELGFPEERVTVVGNGVDLEKFRPIDRGEARRELGIASDATVLVTVGGLVERKGFHRVIEVLPRLRLTFPRLVYLVVGGPSPEGDWRARLEQQVVALGLGDVVRFLGFVPPERLRVPLSASDLFVLSTRNEGWANVFLEAMACGLPVVTTDVGGNREVVCRDDLGLVVPFGDPEALGGAIAEALERRWDTADIVRYAHENSWDSRVERLLEIYRAVVEGWRR